MATFESHSEVFVAFRRGERRAIPAGIGFVILGRCAAGSDRESSTDDHVVALTTASSRFATR